MSQRPTPRSNIRAAIDRQLVDEEAWLSETLKLIRQQRNALRLERIQLEKKRDHLQNVNIDDLIAKRQPQVNQEGNKNLGCATPSSAPTSEPNGSTSDVMSQGNAQGTSGICNNEDNICNKENLKADLSCSSSDTDSDTSSELSDDDGEPLVINKPDCNWQA